MKDLPNNYMKSIFRLNDSNIQTPKFPVISRNQLLRLYFMPRASVPSISSSFDYLAIVSMIFNFINIRWYQKV